MKKMSDNQRYYILHHIKWTDFYDDMPQQNKKYPKLVDNRDEIINDMINDFDVWQASRLIEDIVDENEKMIKIMLTDIGVEEKLEMSKMDAQDQAQELIK